MSYDQSKLTPIPVVAADAPDLAEEGVGAPEEELTEAEREEQVAEGAAAAAAIADPANAEALERLKGGTD